jgi:hypothetical protein
LFSQLLQLIEFLTILGKLNLCANKTFNIIINKNIFYCRAPPSNFERIEATKKGDIFLLCFVTTSPTRAQIVPDATLPVNSTVTPVGNTNIIEDRSD